MDLSGNQIINSSQGSKRMNLKIHQGVQEKWRQPSKFPLHKLLIIINERRLVRENPAELRFHDEKTA